MNEKNITIKKIEEVVLSEKEVEIVYTLLINGNERTLTYKISGEDINGGIPLLCDAVVVTFLLYAIKYGLSFCSEYPISEKLYYNLTKHVIPQFYLTSGTQKNMIQLNMPTTKEVYHGDWVGTGISLGVDSFTTIHEYDEDCDIDEFKLTHLVHLKTGAHHGQLGYFDKQKEDKLFKIENEKVRKFCEEAGYKLIVIESNLLEITCEEFEYGFSSTHSFRNLGCILLLQNLFSKYYYASAFNLDNFDVGIGVSAGHYDKWLLPYISNDSVEFYSANINMTRVEKTRYISNFSDTYANLHICWSESKNCGSCKKCIRTLVTLDILGVLDKYSKSFNLDDYYKNRIDYISEVILMKNMDEGYMEVYQYMKEINYKMPSFLTRMKVAMKILIKKVKEIGVVSVFRFLRKKAKEKTQNSSF